MNWKEFLKLDWKRIILTAIFAIYFLYTYFSGFCAFGSYCQKPSILEIILIYFLNLPILLLSFIPSYFILILLLIIFYWYFLSFFIICFYNKYGINLKKHKKIIVILIIIALIFFPRYCREWCDCLGIKTKFLSSDINIDYYCFGICSQCSNYPIESLKNKACRTFIETYNCSIDTKNILISNYDVNRDGKIDNEDNLQIFADNFYGCKDIDCIKRLCGC
jgi:hypothetical protein